MARYVAIVWFKNGSKRVSGSTDSRSHAERMGAQMYEQSMMTAASDFFKPTRYEVVEKD